MGQPEKNSYLQTPPSSANSSPNRTLVVRDDHYRWIRKHYLGSFLSLLRKIRDEKDPARQLEFVDQYRTSFLTDLSKDDNHSDLAEDGNHFEVLDQFLAEDDQILTTSQENEGAALLLVVRNFFSEPNLQIIANFIQFYSHEKKKAPAMFLANYLDIDRNSILHYLAELIVFKHDSAHLVPADWAALDFVLSSDQRLLQVENSRGQTPADIITESTNLTLKEREVYFINETE